MLFKISACSVKCLYFTRVWRIHYISALQHRWQVQRPYFHFFLQEFWWAVDCYCLYTVSLNLSPLVYFTRNMQGIFMNEGMNEWTQVEILLRFCEILQESCKILIKIKILIRSCLTVKILKDLSKNLVRS